MGIFRKGGRVILSIYRAVQSFTKQEIGRRKGEHLKRKQEIAPVENAFYGSEFDFFRKGDSEIKCGEYQIKSPIVEWSESEIAVEIHCDSGKY